MAKKVKSNWFNRSVNLFFLRTRGYVFLCIALSLVLSLISIFVLFDGYFRHYISLFFFFFLISLILCFIQVSRIWSGISLMEQLLSKIANSNVDFNTELKKFDVSSLRNSISFLSSAFQKLIFQIEITRENIYVLSKMLSSTTDNLYKNTVSQRDSTDYFIQSSTRIDLLLDDIENQGTLIEKNTGDTTITSKDIEVNSEGIYNLVEELISFINAANDIMLQTQKSLKENEFAINEITSFVHYISQSIDDLNNVAEGIDQNVSSTVNLQKLVLEEVQKSESIIRNYSHSIDTIRNTIQSTSKTIDLLSIDSDQINRIIEAIETISRQTNLLSLNASIIAAISKESGRSFNVVADEIRLLSEKTELSTKEIAVIINNIKQSIANSSENIDKSMTIVDSAEEQSLRMYESLLGIIDLAKSSILNIQSIQHTTLSQLNNFHAILENTEDINNQCIDIKNRNITLQSEFDSLQSVALKLADIANGLKNKIHGQLYDAKDIIDHIQEINTTITNILNITSDISIQRESIETAFREIGSFTVENLYTLKDLALTSFNMQSEYNRLETLTDFYKGMKPQHGGELVIDYTFTDNPVIDPTMLTSTDKIMILSCIYEPLLTYSSSSEIKPLLCEKFNISKDGKKITFYLKKNVFFHDGKQMHASDVKYSFERLKQVYPKDSSKLAKFLGPVDGYDEFINGSEDDLSGIKIIDDYTIEINLARPLVFHIQALCQLELSIVPFRNYHTLMPYPVGTGPFRFKRYSEKDYLLLDKFEKYHVAGIPYVDHLRFQHGLRYKDLWEKKAHIISTVNIPNIDFSVYIKSKTGVIIEPVEIYSVNSIILNTEIHPFNNRHVRNAFMLAINREKMIKEVYATHRRKAESYIPVGILGHAPRKDLVRFDLEAAEELLKKSGLAFPAEIEYYLIKGYKPTATIRFLFESLKSVGINVKTIEAERNDYNNMKKKQPFNLIIWHADYLDPDNFLYPIFHSSNIENLGFNCGWSSKEFDELIETAQYEQDIEKRKELYYNAEEILFRDIPAIPLCYNKHFLAHRYELICPTKSVFPYFEPKYCWFFLKDN